MVQDNCSPGKKGRYRRAVEAFERKDYLAAGQEFENLAAGRDLYGNLSRYYAGESYLRLGIEQMRQRAFSSATQAFQRASKWNPSQHTLPKYLACCFSKMQKFDAAQRYCEREVALNQKQSDPRIRLALSLCRNGQQEAAIQALREGILQQPMNVAWHFQLAVLLAAREEHDGAIETLERVIELDPNHTAALVHLGLCYGAKQNTEPAVSFLARAQQQRPDDAKIGLFLAMAANAVQAKGECSELSLAMPVAELAVDVADIEELTDILRNEPEVVEGFLSHQETNPEKNVFELLSAVIDRAILAGPPQAELLHHQARIYRRLGRSDLAIASCERAVEAQPTLVQALITLSRLYLETDREQEARTRLQQVLDMGYEYADVYFQLGCIYRDQGQRDRAKESYHKALEINSNYRAAREALELLAA